MKQPTVAPRIIIVEAYASAHAGWKHVLGEHIHNCVFVTSIEELEVALKVNKGIELVMLAGLGLLSGSHADTVKDLVSRGLVVITASGKFNPERQAAGAHLAIDKMDVASFLRKDLLVLLTKEGAITAADLIST